MAGRLGSSVTESGAPSTHKKAREMDQALLDAKRRLYALLLAKDTDAMADTELDLMVCLAKDRDIQQLLQSYVAKP